MCFCGFGRILPTLLPLPFSTTTSCVFLTKNHNILCFFQLVEANLGRKRWIISKKSSRICQKHGWRWAIQPIGWAWLDGGCWTIAVGLGWSENFWGGRGKHVQATQSGTVCVLLRNTGYNDSFRIVVSATPILSQNRYYGYYFLKILLVWVLQLHFTTRLAKKSQNF